MNSGMALLGGFGCGAALMYFFDPDRGRRRRSLVRDQFTHAAHEMRSGTATAWRDLGHRAQGAGHETMNLFMSDHASDEVIAERVRSRLGRHVSHPSAIQVTVRDRRAILTGPILADEVGNVLNAVSAVRGVTEVESRLDVHQEAGDISALQGGHYRSGERPDFMNSNWAPGTRLLVGSLGGALFAYGWTRSFPTSCILGTLGLGMVARAVSNVDATQCLESCTGQHDETMVEAHA